MWSKVLSPKNIVHFWTFSPLDRKKKVSNCTSPPFSPNFQPLKSFRKNGEFWYRPWSLLSVSQLAIWLPWSPGRCKLHTTCTKVGDLVERICLGMLEKSEAKILGPKFGDFFPWVIHISHGIPIGLVHLDLGPREHGLPTHLAWRLPTPFCTRKGKSLRVGIKHLQKFVFGGFLLPLVTGCIDDFKFETHSNRWQLNHYP